MAFASTSFSHFEGTKTNLNLILWSKVFPGVYLPKWHCHLLFSDTALYVLRLDATKRESLAYAFPSHDKKYALKYHHVLLCPYSFCPHPPSLGPSASSLITTLPSFVSISFETDVYCEF